jgi:hypothetical protein
VLKAANPRFVIKFGTGVNSGLQNRLQSNKFYEMPTVWNKFSNHLSKFHFTVIPNIYILDVLFGGQEKQQPAPLRPSCSLSMLNQKNLRVVPSSQSSENLHKISFDRHTNFDESSTKKPWKKLSASSSHFFHFRKNSTRKSNVKKRSTETASPVSIATTANNTPRKQTPKTSKFLR